MTAQDRKSVAEQEIDDSIADLRKSAPGTCDSHKILCAAQVLSLRLCAEVLTDVRGIQVAVTSAATSAKEAAVAASTAAAGAATAAAGAASRAETEAAVLPPWMALTAKLSPWAAACIICGFITYWRARGWL